MNRMLDLDDPSTFTPEDEERWAGEYAALVALARLANALERIADLDDAAKHAARSIARAALADLRSE